MARARWSAVLASLAVLACGGPEPARLRVEVSPEAARIFVEGEYQGAGRVSLQGLAPGPYHLRIDPPVGYKGRLHEVELAPGQHAQVHLELEDLRAVQEAAETAARAEAQAKADAEEDLPWVRLVTSHGDVELALYEDQAPNTVANFLALANRGFYDGVTFHRVIAGFMIQTGDPLSRDQDPTNDGKGGAGYTFPDEINPHRHDRPGTLSMANSGPDTNSSQFFLTLGPTPWLDGRHTVFGRVAQGMEVVEEIGRVLTDRNDRPHSPVRLERIDVLRSRDHPYHPVDAQGVKLPLPPDRRGVAPVPPGEGSRDLSEAIAAASTRRTTEP